MAVENQGEIEGKHVVMLTGQECKEVIIWQEKLTRMCTHARTHAPVSYTHLRAHETSVDRVCRLLLE